MIAKCDVLIVLFKSKKGIIKGNTKCRVNKNFGENLDSVLDPIVFARQS